MRLHGSTTAVMMAVVVLAALDCLGVRLAEQLAGYWLLGAAMQVGLFAMPRSRGRVTALGRFRGNRDRVAARLHCLLLCCPPDDLRMGLSSH